MQLCEVLQGDEEMGVSCRSVVSEGAVGRSESCYRGAITGRGRREIRDGFDRFVFQSVNHAYPSANHAYQPRSTE